MSKRTFTKQEKLSILKEASEQGVTKTLKKYGIYSATYYSWKEKLSSMGEEGLDYGMTKALLKRIRELEKENKLLKELVAEKELEGKLKDELIKKEVCLAEKKELVTQYNSQGMSVAKALSIVQLNKHQYYYQSKGTKQGTKPSLLTPMTSGNSVENTMVVLEIKRKFIV